MVRTLYRGFPHIRTGHESSFSLVYCWPSVIVNSGNYSERSRSVCLFWLNKEMITQQHLSDNRTHQRAIID